MSGIRLQGQYVYQPVPKRRFRTKHVKIFTVIALSLAIGLFFGCAKEKGAEVPKQESLSKNLVPPKTEVKGPNFTVELSDLQISMIVDTTSKQIVDTPNLRGRYKVTNTSKDRMEVQAVTLEYMDEGGRPIAFKSGEKIAKASLFLQALKPGETSEGSLDVTIPRAAVKELRKIDINLVYIPSPLKRETLTLPEKVE
jgi:hypothetical protein